MARFSFNIFFFERVHMACCPSSIAWSAGVYRQPACLIYPAIVPATIKHDGLFISENPVSYEAQDVIFVVFYEKDQDDGMERETLHPVCQGRSPGQPGAARRERGTG